MRNSVLQVVGMVEESYEAKPREYFAGVRRDMVKRLPDNPAARILEIGCGHGGTGELALREGKCCEYVGVEISEAAAQVARQKLSAIVVGNVETIDLPWPDEYFDAVVISEVLEHLIDPWRVMRRLRPKLRMGGQVMASSPNIAQYRVIRSLLRGDWVLADRGVFDRTHLRWFTPKAYCNMFSDAGYAVDEIGPVVSFSWRARLFSLMTRRRFDHILMRQIMVVAHRNA